MKCKTLIAAILFMVMTGCNTAGNSELSANIRSISFTADITYYNENYMADCIIDGNGDLVVFMTLPESLSGLSIEYMGGKCSVKYNGMVIDNASSFLPETSAVSLLKCVMDDCANHTVEQKNKTLLIKGNCKGSDYSMTLAPTGLPITLDFPQYGMKTAFKNVAILNKEKTGEN